MSKTGRKIIIFLLAFCVAAGLAPPASAESSTGVIDADELNALISECLGDYSGDVGIGYYYSPTGESWYSADADVFMYSASLYKVPNCMILEEMENEGAINQNTEIYGYTVARQEHDAIVNSDNDRGHDIVRYLGGDEWADKCSDRFIKYTDLPESYFSDSRFLGDSYYTARYYTQILSYLFEHSEEYPHVIELMQETQPGHYLHTMQDDAYTIAQKYGEYGDKDDGPVYHAAGIIYCPSPVVVTVMTRNAGYDESRFGRIAQTLVNYTYTLDERYEQLQLDAEETPEPTEEPVAETPEPTATPEPTPEPVLEHDTDFPVWLVFVCAGVFAAAAFTAIKLKRAKNKKEKYKPKH